MLKPLHNHQVFEDDQPVFMAEQFEINHDLAGKCS